jgi:hypothetical protein
MTRLDNSIKDAVARALQYNTGHALVPAVTRATTLFTELDGIKTGIEADMAAQATGFTGFRGGAGERKQAYLELLAEMRVMNRIALGLDKAAFPAMREQFRMPRSRTYANITAQGRAFATNAAGQEAIFTDRGLPAGFLAAFSTKVDAAEDAINARNTGLLNRAGATAGIKAKGRRAVAILRELDSIMAVALRNDPVLLGAWKVARRIARRAPATPEETPAGGGGGSTPPPSGS